MPFEPAEALGEEELAAIEQAESGGSPLDTDNVLVKGLLSTKPDLKASAESERFGGNMATTHGYIGTRKFLHGVGLVGADSGVPAVVHFMLVPVIYLRQSAEGQQEQPTTETSESPAYEATEPHGDSILTDEELEQGYAG